MFETIKSVESRTSDARKFASVVRFFLLFGFLHSSFVFAQQAGEDFGFKTIPVSVSSAAMGGDQIASYSNDVNQLSANPALFDSTLHQAVSITYLNYLTDVNQSSLSYAHLLDSIGLVSGYFRYLDYGTFTETDEFGNELGKFKSAEYELGLSFTKQYSDRIYYGITLKQFYSNLYKNFAFGAALDGGVYYIDSRGLTMGVTLNNVGAKLVDYNSNGINTFRPSLNFSVAKKFSKAPLRLGLQYNNLETWDLASTDLDASNFTTTDALTGETNRRKFTADNFARHLAFSVAFVPSEKFNLMAGFNFRRRLELAAVQRPGLIGFSLGAQIKIKRFQLQYAVSGYNINGASNHLALSTNLNEWYKKKQSSSE